MAIFGIGKKKKGRGESSGGQNLKIGIKAGRTQSIREGFDFVNQQRNQDAINEENRKPSRSGGKKFTDTATNLPLGIGTTIKTLATGFSTLLGQRDKAEEQLGGVTGGDLATSALTIGGLAAGGLAAGKALGVAGKAGGKATISTTSQLGNKAPSLTQTRNFIGRPPKSGVSKIFNLGRRGTASRFATTGKSQLLTGSIFSKIGLGPAAVGTALATIGTYPFAGFIKEEALQSSSLAFNTAFFNKDKQGMQESIQRQEEILDPGVTKRILSIVPFVNVLSELRNYFKSARVQVENQKRVFINA